ncbi:MAG: sarcosine oxidase subunit alpha [Rhodobacteraceae bacterium]|nr:sarcosine oxidase subunit alpha [Paracoccaceae bacterium]
MARRLPDRGRLIDRARPAPFRWNGRALSGFEGDTLASALLANGEVLMGRSFKYHRPRGAVASGAEEPNALAAIGAGAGAVPNTRATTQPLRTGLEAASQNHWPSLEMDVGELNAFAAPLFPAGFYYKTFIHPRRAWKHLFEPVIRNAAGLGRAPDGPDPDRYEYFYATYDVLIAGGGTSGLAAALAAGASGARVLVVEQSGWWGGRAATDGVTVDGRPAADWVSDAVARLSDMANVTLRLNAQAAGVYDHGYALVAEQAPRPAGASGLRERLWRVRARRIVTATGAIERPLAFAGNDRPGVMLASAVRDYLDLWGVACGERTVLAANNDDGYRTALALKAAGLEVPAILDARDAPAGPLVDAARDAGILIRTGMGVMRALGRKQVSGVEIGRIDGSGRAEDRIDCDCVAMSGGWSPVVHLWSHCGGKLLWDDGQALFRPDPDRPPLSHDGAGFVIAAGTAAGRIQAPTAMADAHEAGLRAVEGLGEPASPAAIPMADAEAEGPLHPVWTSPAKMPPKLASKAFLDFQNDVKVADVQLAAREGYESVEHAKRYTTLGMATDQGKTSNIAGLAILAEARGAAIPEVGTTTFRPPYTPLTLGALAGEARGPLFKPVRKTPMDAWHDRHGAHWEPVADWRRPYAFLRDGERVQDAVTREIVTVRERVGMMDASTLGKLLVKGPDAGRFLDLLYTNMMSSLKPGKCRYGLMCTEQGFLFDDGVAARLSADAFLVHNTTGGADRVHAWMEEWLQTEWWDLKVHVANLTEQYAQIAVAGPKARAVLEKLGGMALDGQALPFLGWAEGELAGIPARVYRISFSGELSFELAVPAGRGQEMWDRLAEAGAEFGIAPYGTEAMHVLRAEKGFIMIGDETDGTVTPLDLGLGWAVSKKKTDFIGKRGMERSDLSRPDRLRLVGLETEDPSVVIPDGAHALEDLREDGRARTAGHVTSTYWSPTLGRSIAMALLERGPERLGEVVRMSNGAGAPIPAKIVSPVFFDPDGERQNG